MLYQFARVLLSWQMLDAKDASAIVARTEGIFLEHLLTMPTNSHFLMLSPQWAMRIPETYLLYLYTKARVSANLR
jgi:hypothetical protein